MINLIKKIIEDLFIFLWEPKKFTLNWIENVNHIQEKLLPLIIIYSILIISFGLINFSFGLYQSNKKNQLFTYFKDTIGTYITYMLLNTGLIYYIYTILQGNQINLLKSVIFSLTIIIFMLFFLFIFIISLIIIIAFIFVAIYLIKLFIMEMSHFYKNIIQTNDKTNVLVNVKKVKEWNWNVSFIVNSILDSILEIRQNFSNGVSILLFIGFIVCYSILVLYASRIYIISICTFYNFSVLSWFIIILTYSVISSVINAVWWLIKVISRKGRIN
ncbi:MAG: hypothetical protein QNJ42_20870 [Crocosphaera sp.]|nr:hypothetical protein [Crocosphaera sp.]